MEGSGEAEGVDADIYRIWPTPPLTATSNAAYSGVWGGVQQGFKVLFAILVHSATMPAVAVTL
jgi:hypothetical protein